MFAATAPFESASRVGVEAGDSNGTPVVEDYVDKMSFPFTGTLKNLS